MNKIPKPRSQNIILDPFYQIIDTIYSLKLSPPINFLIFICLIIAVITSAPLIIALLTIYVLYKQMEGSSFMNKEEVLTNLFLAIHKNDISLAKKMLKKGADLNSLDIQGKSLLHLAVEKNNLSLIKALKEYHINVNIIDKFYGCTALYLAVKKDYFDIVSLLLEYKADPNISDIRENTPLSLAVSYNKISIVKLLLKHGANANTQDIFNESPINIAISKGNIEIALNLLDNPNLKLDIENKEKMTPLHSAAIKGLGYEEVLEKILTLKPDIINYQNINGDTALHLSFKVDNITNIKTLLAYNASLNIKNKSAKAPFDFAKSEEARLLIELSPELQKLTYDFYTDINDRIYNDILPKVNQEIKKFDESFVDEKKLIADLPNAIWPEIILRTFPNEVKDLAIKNVTIDNLIAKIIENIFEVICTESFDQENFHKKHRPDLNLAKNKLSYLVTFIEKTKDSKIKEEEIKIIFDKSFNKFPQIISTLYTKYKMKKS